MKILHILNQIDFSVTVPWVLNFGKNGILVDVNSPNEIAEAVEKLVNDKMLYEKLSEDGLQYVMKNFGDENIAKRYFEIFNKIVND